MAQIREFTSTNTSYFILDGVKYPKSYEAVDDSSLNDYRLKVIPIGRTGEQLLYSTHYRNVSVNGNRFNSLEESISAINEVVFSKGGGSGDGGTFDGIITQNSDTVIFTGNGIIGNPLNAKGYNGSYSTTETKTGGTWIDDKPIYRKVFTGSTHSDIVNLTSVWNSDLLNIERVVKADGWIKRYTEKYFLNSSAYGQNATHNTISVLFDDTNNGGDVLQIGILLKETNTYLPDCPYTIIVDYTKVTD